MKNNDKLVTTKLQKNRIIELNTNNTILAGGAPLYYHFKLDDRILFANMKPK